VARARAMAGSSPVAAAARRVTATARGGGARLAARARELRQQRERPLSERMREQRRERALRAEAGGIKEADIVLLDDTNAPDTVRREQRRAELRRSISGASDDRRGSVGDVFAVASNRAPDTPADADELSPAEERRRREERSSFVRRGSNSGVDGALADECRFFAQPANVPTTLVSPEPREEEAAEDLPQPMPAEPEPEAVRLPERE